MKATRTLAILVGAMPIVACSSPNHRADDASRDDVAISRDDGSSVESDGDDIADIASPTDVRADANTRTDAATDDASDVARDAMPADTSSERDASSGDAAGPLPSCFTEPTQQRPLADVRSFGALGDGAHDDTAAIQAAIDSLASGGTVVFAPGVYRYTAVIHVRHPGVHLWGYPDASPGPAGATLHADDVANQAISLEADQTAIYGFILTARTDGTRRSTPQNHRIVLDHSAQIEVIDNEVREGTAAGIFAYGASDYLIARNFVGNTYADHIHNTGRCSNGRIVFNTIDGSLRGDDAIAVVSYTSNFNTNILIEGNTVLGSAWGNGVDVTGAQDVTVRNNSISNICHNGGIEVKNEPTFNITARNENILVEGNQISSIEAPGCFDLHPPHTGQMGLDMWTTTTMGGYNRGLLFRGNRIDLAYTGAIHVRDGNCEVGLENNAVTNSPGAAIRTGGFVPSSTCRLVCAGNTSDGAPATAAACVDGPMPAVTGSSLHCMP
jgi:polygalacturonase